MYYFLLIRTCTFFVIDEFGESSFTIKLTITSPTKHIIVLFICTVKMYSSVVYLIANKPIPEIYLGEYGVQINKNNYFRKATVCISNLIALKKCFFVAGHASLIFLDPLLYHISPIINQ